MTHKHPPSVLSEHTQHTTTHAPAPSRTHAHLLQRQECVFVLLDGPLRLVLTGLGVSLCGGCGGCGGCGEVRCVFAMSRLVSGPCPTPSTAHASPLRRVACLLSFSLGWYSQPPSPPARLPRPTACTGRSDPAITTVISMRPLFAIRLGCTALLPRWQPAPGALWRAVLSLGPSLACFFPDPFNPGPRPRGPAPSQEASRQDSAYPLPLPSFPHCDHRRRHYPLHHSTHTVIQSCHLGRRGSALPPPPPGGTAFPQ